MTSGSNGTDWRADVVRGNAVPSDVVQRWRAITAEDPLFESPFYSVDFVQAVAQVHPDVRVAVLRQGQEMRGFLPFQFTGRWGRFLGAAERVGGGMSDYFGLIAAPGARLHPKELLRLCRLTSLEFSHLDETQTRLGLHGKQPEVGHRVRLSTGGATAYWAGLRKTDKRFVADSERCLRKLAEAHGPLRFEFMASDIGVELARLIETKRAQYRRTGVGDPLATGWCEDLLRVLAANDSSDCQGILSTLYSGDTWVASHFGLRNNRVLHYWFPVYNLDMKAFSPGRLLLKAMIEAADAVSIRSIDFGAGDQPAKREFSNENHTYFRDVWSVPGPRSLCFRAIQSVGWRLAARSPDN